MNRSDRAGVTLGEVVVVAVILVLAVAMLLMYLFGSRINSQRAYCVNREHQLSLALLDYDAHQGHLPGYANLVGEKKLAASWVVPLLPYLDRNDLWKVWNDGEAAHRFLKVVLCPSNPPEQIRSDTVALGYVVNCGLPGDDDTRATAVFFNHAGRAESPSMTVAYLKQHGASTTKLMLSENLQAGYWTDTSEADVGMTWLRTPGKCSPINACKDAGRRPQDLQYARPSSNHVGGVNVTFCDGHDKFLSDKIEYRVFQYLMTPDSQAAGLIGKEP